MIDCSIRSVIIFIFIKKRIILQLYFIFYFLHDLINILHLIEAYLDRYETNCSLSYL